MKEFKKILLIAIMTMLVNTSFSYGNINNEEDLILKENLVLYTEENKKDSVNKIFDIETKSIIEDSEFFKARIKYPFLKIKDKNTNKKDSKVKIVESINEEIYEYILEFKNRIKEESKQYEKDYKKIYSKQKEQYVKYQYEAYSEYEVTYNKNNILSIPITTYEFTGGAHGMTYLKSYNYNLLTGKQIKIKDIFKSGTDYEKIINDYISKEIEKNKDLYFTGENGFKGISSNQDFYIEKDGLVVYFQRYDIAPYYVGIPKFKIPWNQFGATNIDME